MTIGIITAIAEIFGLFSIGAIARWLGYITDREIDRWSKLILDILFPLFMFTSIINGFDVDRLHELWVLPVVGLGMVVFFTVAGLLLRFGLLSARKGKQRTFVHICAVNNSTFLPVVILTNIWGEKSLANLFLLYLGTAAAVWTLGVAILGGTTLKESLKKVVTPVLVAIFTASVVAVSGAKELLPDLLMRIIHRAGGIAVPLMLVLIGASLAHRRTVRLTWPVIYSTLVRLILLPLMIIPLLRFLPLPDDVCSIAVIVALMPSAVSTVIMTRRYGGDPDYAASTALMTTLCSIVTVPLAVWFLF